MNNQNLTKVGLIAVACLSQVSIAMGSEAEGASLETGGAQSNVATVSAVPVDSGSAGAYAETVAVSVGDDAPPAPLPAEPLKRRGSIEEIVVTAQKREENLMAVPISISAFTGDQLTASNVTSALDLARITPGLTYNSLAGYSLIYIRGVGSDVFLPTADTSIATYMDGIYMPFLHNLAQELGEVERIEVLKGPQGTLFGRNATGGAINIVTKAPSSEALEGNLQLTASGGDRDNYKGKLFVTGPITETIAASGSLLYDYATPWYTVTSDSTVRSLPNDVTKGGNVKLLWAPNDLLTMTLNGVMSKYDGLGANTNSQLKPSLLGTAVGLRPQPAYQTSADEPSPHMRADNKLGSLIVQLAPSWFDVKLLGSYQKVLTDTIVDIDATEKDVLRYSSAEQFAKVLTSELNFTSKDGGLLGDSLEWTGGLFYIRSDAGFDPAFIEAPGLSEYTNGTIPDLIPPGALTLVDQLNIRLAQAGLPPLPIPSGVNLNIAGIVRTDALAQYVQTTFSTFEWLKVTLGLRHQSEKRTLTKSEVALRSNDGGSTPLLPYPEQSSKTNNTSPKVTLDFIPFENGKIYASWQQAYKSGTYNPVNILPPEFVLPEKVTTYEVGAKGEMLDGALRVTVAAFHNTIKNYQQLYVALASGGAVTVYNAPEAVIKGADFDVTWLVLPEIAPDLMLTINGAFLRGEYTDFPEGRGFDEKTGIFFTSRDFTGNETVRTPKFSGSLAINDAVQFESGKLDFGVDVYYNSGYYFDAQNATPQPDYTLLGARVGYRYEPWNAKLTLFGTNLTSARYFYNIFPNDFGQFGTYAPRSTYGLRLSWEF